MVVMVSNDVVVVPVAVVVVNKMNDIASVIMAMGDTMGNRVTARTVVLDVGDDSLHIMRLCVVSVFSCSFWRSRPVVWVVGNVVVVLSSW